MAKVNLSLYSRQDRSSDWSCLVKQTVARFARGNISAQNARILMPEEQEREHEAAKKITQKWTRRVKH